MLDPRRLGLAATHLSEVAGRVWRILRTLFHEVIGFVFLVLAGWGALWLIRAFRGFNGEGEGLFKMAVVAVFVVMMSSFGVSSFWRARRISRDK